MRQCIICRGNNGSISRICNCGQAHDLCLRTWQQYAFQLKKTSDKCPTCSKVFATPFRPTEIPGFAHAIIECIQTVQSMLDWTRTPLFILNWAGYLVALSLAIIMLIPLAAEVTCYADYVTKYLFANGSVESCRNTNAEICFILSVCMAEITGYGLKRGAVVYYYAMNTCTRWQARVVVHYLANESLPSQRCVANGTSISTPVQYVALQTERKKKNCYSFTHEPLFF